MTKKELFERMLKSFVEGFAGALVTELSVAAETTETIKDFNDFILVLIPILGGAIGAGISAVWNILEQKIKEKKENEEKKD